MLDFTSNKIVLSFWCTINIDVRYFGITGWQLVTCMVMMGTLVGHHARGLSL